MEEQPLLPRLPAFPAFTLDPLESAITATAQTAAEAEGLTLSILQDHLKKLCDAQIKKLCADLLQQAVEMKAPGL